MKNIVYSFALLIISISLLQAQDTIKVRAGWNIIGGISTYALNQLRTEPEGIITSFYFGYSPTGYTAMDTINKGEGYWVKANQAGIILYKNQPPAIPTSPIPNNYATDVTPSPTLSWTCSDPENDPLTYDVYLGTDNPPTIIVSSGQSNNSLSRSGLSGNTTYYWKIVAKDNHGDSSSSQIWRFTTTAIITWSCGSQITYENQIYNTVLIGSQCWFKENLNIGMMILGDSNQTNNSTIEKYCYNDSIINCTIYGGLYQWNEAMQYSTTEGAQGICPTGWHMPTQSEYQTLSTTVGNDGNALKAVGQGNGTNTSGFSALFAGARDFNGYFVAIRQNLGIWTSTENNATNSTSIGLNYVYVDIQTSVKGYGFSVRCIKD